MRIPSKQFIRHIKSSQNIGLLAYASGRAKGSSGCGDAVEVQLRVSGDSISDIKCMPHGCLNTLACANALAELVKGQRIKTAKELQPEDVAQELGGLPDEHMHCARLAVNTLAQAVDDYFQRSSYWIANRYWDNRLSAKKKDEQLL